MTPMLPTPTLVFFGVTSSQRKQKEDQPLGTENIQIIRSYPGEERENRVVHPCLLGFINIKI